MTENQKKFLKYCKELRNNQSSFGPTVLQELINLVEKQSEELAKLRAYIIALDKEFDIRSDRPESPS